MITIPDLYQTRCDLLRGKIGRRHRLVTIPCDACQRPLFRERKQKCPGKFKYRPPTLAGYFHGKPLCPKCWERLANGSARKPVNDLADTIDPATIPTEFIGTAASIRSATAALPAGAPLEIWVQDPATNTAKRAVILRIRPVVRGKKSRLTITVREAD